MRRLLACALLVSAGCSASAPTDVATPSPLHASQPAPVNRVISAAIWVNPVDASRSRVIITNAARGIEVHDLDGYLLKHLDEGYATDSVTILHGFPLAGKPTDLVLATYPDERVAGVKMWYIDADKVKLKELKGSDSFKVPGNANPMGITAYHSHVTDKCYVFFTSYGGDIDQFELTSDSAGNIAAKRVRQLKVPSKTQGCVADEDRGVVYFSEEKSGVWRFNAEPDADPIGTEVIKAGEHGLVPDVEGVGLYTVGASDGYLIVVGQGEKSDRSRLNIYDRQDAHFIGAIVPSAANGNAIEFASGVAVTSTSLPQYPQGMLLIKDHINSNASEDFKYFSWGDVAKSLRLRSK